MKVVSFNLFIFTKLSCGLLLPLDCHGFQHMKVFWMQSKISLCLYLSFNLASVSFSSFVVLEKLLVVVQRRAVVVCPFAFLELSLSFIQPSEFITSNKTCFGILKKNVNSMRQRFSSVVFPYV